jgi:3-phosphoshikimate 1-carboxyvinyltransferase
MPEVLTFRVPGSKSQTQRALLLAALAEGESELIEPLVCDDTLHLLQALRSLSIPIEQQGLRWRILGGATPRVSTVIHCGDGGTTLRFLAALSALMNEELLLDGSEQLRQRPLTELIDALAQLGVEPRFSQPGPGLLPLGLQRTGVASPNVEVDVSRSSQFASALMMIGPRLPQGLHLHLKGLLVSAPYLLLTVAMMRAFGAEVQEEELGYSVRPGGYRPGIKIIEGDWSSAAFLLVASWITGRHVHLLNLDDRSAQGDRQIVEFLVELDQPRPHRLDLTHCPDLVAPLAVAAAFASHPVQLVNLAHARHKESDRLAVLSRELGRAGVRITEEPTALRLEPGGALQSVTLEPAGDHRMAMAFGLLTLRWYDLKVANRECVAKSYPTFWRDLARLADRP